MAKNNKRMENRDRIIELLTTVRYTTNDIEKVADEICLLFNVSVPNGTSCPRCGYPKFKKHHEDFERCEGCEWTGQDAL